MFAWPQGSPELLAHMQEEGAAGVARQCQDPDSSALFPAKAGTSGNCEPAAGDVSRGSSAAPAMSAGFGGTWPSAWRGAAGFAACGLVVFRLKTRTRRHGETAVE